MRCIICNKEINGGFIVEKECVEALKAENQNYFAKKVKYFIFYHYNSSAANYNLL